MLRNQATVNLVSVSKRFPRRREASRFFSDLKKDEKQVKKCSNDLTALLGGDSSKALEISKLLSQTARHEVSLLRDRINAKALKGAVTEPSKKDLRLNAFIIGVPFIGFGFMDNSILIIAGESIDANLGVLLGISTMCAAAFGNIISNIAGVGTGAYIEDFCSRYLNLPTPKLSQAQRNLRSVRLSGQVGTAIGITIGCMLGMSPLLFMDTDKVQVDKQDAHMETIFRDMVSEAKGLIGAESTCLFLVVDTDSCTLPSDHAMFKAEGRGRYLYGKYTDKSFSQKENAALRAPIGKGIVSRAVLKGDVMNVPDVSADPGFHPESNLNKQIPADKIRSMLAVPVFDVHGNVIAVIQALNKADAGSAKIFRKGASSKGFTESDVNVLQTLAPHVSVTLQNMHSNGETSLRDTIQILKRNCNIEVK